jgi:hypothetical protein
MNWEKLTPFMQIAKEKSMNIKEDDERIAVFVFMVAEMVEFNERESCAGLCDRFANRMMTAEECADAIRARG